MVPDQYFPPSNPAAEEWPYIYQTRGDSGGSDSFLSQPLTASPCSTDATLVNDDEHLQADIYRLILSPENARSSNDPDSSSADRKSPSPKSTFNPHAVPFVPNQSSLPGWQVQPNARAPVAQDTPAWLSSFWQGATSTLPAEQVSYAKHVAEKARSCLDISALARSFSSQCMIPHNYASFARAVYDTFNDAYGTWESSRFRFHLQKLALESFDYAWSIVCIPLVAFPS